MRGSRRRVGGRDRQETAFGRNHARAAALLAPEKRLALDREGTDVVQTPGPVRPSGRVLVRTRTSEAPDGRGVDQ